MDTLLEFITFTKGVEYLIAVASLIGFIAFWQLVYGEGKGLALRVAALVFLSLGPLILAASRLVTMPR